jgi:hypothetical protein
VLKPWRCGHCNQLVYCVATGPKGNFVPYFGDVIEPASVIEPYGPICQTCNDIYFVLTASGWFRGLHDEWKKQNAHSASKLRPGSNYLE